MKQLLLDRQKLLHLRLHMLDRQLEHHKLPSEQLLLDRQIERQKLRDKLILFLEPKIEVSYRKSKKPYPLL